MARFALSSQQIRLTLSRNELTMTNDAHKHPERDQLLAFGMGKLEEDEAEQIAQHLDSCDDCSETIVNLQDDTFVSLVRSSPAPDAVKEVELEASKDQAARPDVTVDVGSGLTAEDERTAAELPAELRDHPRYEILELIGRGEWATSTRRSTR